MKTQSIFAWNKSIPGRILRPLMAGLLLAMTSSGGSGMEPTNHLSRAEAVTELGVDGALADYLRHAALHNSDVEAAFHRWRAALEETARSGYLPDPKLSYGYFLQEVETRVGPQRQRVGLSQTVPWFGKLSLKEEMSGAEAAARYQEFQAAKLKLYYQVKEVWYELYFLGRSMAITEDNIQLLSHLEGVAQARYKAGQTLTGVVKAQVELGKLSERLAALQDSKRPLAARLNAHLNRAPEAEVKIPERLETRTYEVDEGLWAGWLETSNPEMQGLSSLVSKEEKAMALARKDVFPDFNFGLDYIQTDRRRANVPDNGKDAVVAMISINIPLWAGRNKAGVRQAEQRREAAVQARNQRFHVLEADLRMAAYRYRDAERKIDLYRNTLQPLAEISLNVAQQAWEVGQADFLELIDAQRLLLQFQLDEERARADREQRIAEMEMLLGREFTSPDTAESRDDLLEERTETSGRTRP